jgi:hypothetical protein
MVRLARIQGQCPRVVWRKSRTLLVGLAALCAVAPAAGAQTPMALRVGTHVRLIAPANTQQSARCYNGSLVSLRSDTLVMHTGEISCPDPLTVALGKDWQVEERATHHDYAILGAVIGGGLVLAVGALIKADSKDSFGAPPMLGAAIAAPVFALGGAFIGAQFRRDTWVPVSTDDVRVGDAEGAVGIDVAF